jgi:hypothetical protein
MEASTEYLHSLKQMRKYLSGFGIVVLIMQVILDSSSLNVFANSLAILPYIISIFIIFQPINKTTGRSLTGVAVFVAIAANSIAPMVGTLIEGHALTYSLIQPVETFFHRMLFGLSLITAHLFATFLFTSKKGGILSLVGAMVGSRVLISTRGILMLGFIGIAAVLLKLLPLPIVFVKLLDGLGFLMWVPYILLIPPYSTKKIKTNVWVPLVLLYVVHVSLSLGANSRMGMVAPIATVGAAWLVGVVSGVIAVHAGFIRRVGYLMAAGVLIMGVLGDFSTAILIERAHRDTRTVGEQFDATFETFLNKDELSNYEVDDIKSMEAVGAENHWTENYIRNPFIGRFVQVKFDDNCFQRVSMFGEYEKEALWKASTDRVLAQVPDPFLKPLDIEIDKIYVNSYSMGDMIEVLSGKGFLGGKRTGSIPAHAYALFGEWYILVLVALYSILFSLIQNLFLPVYRSQYVMAGSISTLALLLAFKLYTDMSMDAVTELVAILVRGLWQLLLMYGLSIWLTRKFTSIPKLETLSTVQTVSRNHLQNKS